MMTNLVSAAYNAILCILYFFFLRGVYTERINSAQSTCRRFVTFFNFGECISYHLIFCGHARCGPLFVRRLCGIFFLLLISAPRNRKTKLQNTHGVFLAQSFFSVDIVLVNGQKNGFELSNFGMIIRA